MYIMRVLKKFKSVRVDLDVHTRLVKDRFFFEGVIGGGKWSLSDVIRNYQKEVKR